MKIVAHRGYSARFAENSLAAFEQAIACGADLVETDVRMTRDGVLVCWHDPDLRRVAGAEVEIAASSADALSAMALPGGARVCRLADVLALVRGRVALLLDVKIDDAAGRAAIIDAVAAAGMTDHVVYGVRNAEHARALTAAKACFARLAMPAQPDALDAFPPEQLLGARLWEDQVDGPAIERIRSRQLEVWVTAGVRSRGEAPGYITTERLQALRNLRVDAVLVNDVELAAAHLRTEEEP